MEKLVESYDFKNCGSCNEQLGEEDKRRPRTLKCNHYLCTECINNLIKADDRRCPFCKTTFQAETANDVAVNSSVLDFLKCRRATERGRDVPDCSMMEVREAVEVAFTKVKDARTGAERSLREIEEMMKDVDFGKDAAEELLSKLTELKGERERINERLGKEREEILSRLNETSKRMQRLERIKERIDSSETLIDGAARIRNAVKRIGDKFEEKSSENEIRIIGKDLAEFRKTVSSTFDDIDSLRANFVKSVNGPEINLPDPCNITLDELREMSERIQFLAFQGRLFAIRRLVGGEGGAEGEEGEGGEGREGREGREIVRYAQITFREDKMLLHHLEDLEMFPNSAVIIEHSEVLTLVDPSSRIAFLDLYSREDDLFLGTMYINLSPDTQGARQFALLCTGEMGPTYANTRLLHVEHRGTRVEQVKFGDYEKQDGTGGRALLEDLVAGEEDYCRRRTPGLVTGVGWRTGNVSLSAQFLIRTGEGLGNMADSAFGCVVEGLDLLQDVVDLYPQMKSVIIEDCGLVLKM